MSALSCAAAVALSAPIVVFLHARPEHSRRCLDSLAANPEFAASPLYLFCDGARDERSLARVEAVRRMARRLEHPRKQVIESPVNRGLAASVIDGVGRVLARHGRVIVVEDDLVLGRGFLRYMNDALERYHDHERVMQVSGHMWPVEPEHDGHDALFLPVANSWGWATWSRAWRHFDPDMREMARLERLPELRRRFDVGGACPYFEYLRRQRAGRADSWFVRWYLSLFMRDGLVLYPRRSLVRNLGFDGTGVHCGAGGSPYDGPGTPHDHPPLRLPEPRAHLPALAQVSDFLARHNTFGARLRRRMRGLLAR